MRENETALEKARRHVRRGSLRVSRQKALIAKLARQGANIEDAMSTLRTLRETLQTMRVNQTREELAARRTTGGMRARSPGR